MTTYVRRGSEDAEQETLIQWARLCSGRWPELKLLHHVPNGGSRDRKEAAKLKRMGVLAVEMEAAGLYLNAARAGKNALAICTISDHIFRGESLPAEDRQLTFTQMMEIALEIA